jgi:hypothetical protein
MQMKKYVLATLMMLLSGVIYMTVKAKQKNGIPHDFSGQWKAKASISMGGNIFCSYDASDRMVAKSMKIEEKAGFLTVENQDSATGSTNRLEKLIFDGKTRQMSHSQDNKKTYSVNLSKDGQTMTIKSTVYFMTSTPYKVNVKQQAYTQVTEVWNLSKDGHSIAVLAKAKSNIWQEERAWKTVFERSND